MLFSLKVTYYFGCVLSERIFALREPVVLIGIVNDCEESVKINNSGGKRQGKSPALNVTTILWWLLVR